MPEPLTTDDWLAIAHAIVGEPNVEVAPGPDGQPLYTYIYTPRILADDAAPPPEAR